MLIVPTQCPQCGANIDLDELYKTGACPYCDTAFISQEAIRDAYNARHGNEKKKETDLDALLVKALQYEVENKNNKALEYYRRVLEVDSHHSDAREGVMRLKKKMKAPEPVKDKEEKAAFAGEAASPQPVTGAAVENNVKKSRGLMWFLSIFCFFGAVVFFVGTFPSRYYMLGSAFYGLCGLMFLGLAKTPKGSNYLFGKTKGLRKGLFVTLCLAAAIACTIVAENSCEHVYEMGHKTFAGEEMDELVLRCTGCGKELTPTEDDLETIGETTAAEETTAYEPDQELIITYE